MKKFLHIIIIYSLPVHGPANCQNFPDLPPAERPSPTNLEYLAQSFLLHVLRVLDEVHRAACRFLRVLDFA